MVLQIMGVPSEVVPKEPWRSRRLKDELRRSLPGRTPLEMVWAAPISGRRAPGPLKPVRVWVLVLVPPRAGGPEQALNAVRQQVRTAGETGSRLAP